MQDKWQRRDRKEKSKRKFTPDNRVGLRNIQTIWKAKSDEIKSQSK